MLDSDLAALYEVETKRLNEQVRRNAGRFPSDFMFRASDEEFRNLKSPFATSSWGGSRKSPMRVQLREVLSSHKVLAQKLDELERRVTHHDNSLASVIDAIRALTSEPRPVKRAIGFTSNLEKQ